MENPTGGGSFAPISFEEVKKVLGATIKGDDDNKLITFLCMLTAYTDSSQFNISFNAPSSTGKSYIPIEVSTLFPKEDVKALGHCTPTAFFYDLSEYDRFSNTGNVDLERKIIIFLDQPHLLLLARLRPILSHDLKQIELKVTDKTERGSLKTKNIIVNGFPSVIFCTAGLNIDEQEATRFILLSPDMGQEKIREAIFAKIKKESDKKRYQDELDSDPARQLLKQRILAIREEFIYEIKIENEIKVKERFLSCKPFLKARHMRDIGKVIGFIKASALLNLWHRKQIGKILAANDEDIENGFALWESIHISQELNLPPYLYELHKKVIVPLCLGGRATDRKGVQQAYLKTYRNPVEEWKLRQEILPMLEAAGLIVQEPDPGDNRKILINVPDAKK